MKKYLLEALLVSAGCGLTALGASLVAYHRSLAGGLALLALGFTALGTEFVIRRQDKVEAVGLVCFFALSAGVAAGFMMMLALPDPFTGIWVMFLCGMPAYMIMEGLDARYRNKQAKEGYYEP